MTPHVDRRGVLVSAGVSVVIAVAVALTVVPRASLVLPVSIDPPGGVPGASDPTPRFEFGHVNIGLAIVLLLALAAVVRLIPPVHTTRWIEYGLIAPITTFLVAQLNGVTDAGSLIAIYSLTSAMVLFDVAQLNSQRVSAMSPWGLGTMVGIVPWGIIALHQVGGVVAGNPAQPIVQLLTMSTLVLSAATSYGLWREFSGSATMRTYLVLSTVTVCVFAVETAMLILVT